MSAAPAPGAPIVFDLDGTLVLSEHIHRQTWFRFFDDWGARIDEDTYRNRFVGRRAADALPEVDGPWRDTPLEELVGELAEHSTGLAEQVRPVPGATALLTALAGRGHRLAVVTSARRKYAERVLDRVLGAAPLVGFLVTAGDVTRGKPDPEGYLTACRRLAADPGDCWAFEDSPAGVSALVAAGIGTIVGVCSTATPAELVAAGAHRTVPDLRAQAPV
ncbi:MULTISPECIES: HAD family hydrolase [Pseudonocardia]|uniref:Phosphorylated carbohydrates phosphatase n=2 Tax=Pseudonocardia TaxID=1847 RepID=A0A1Y2N1A5_PSEAH|nr:MULTISPECIES: HAD-IA family hydrolase [Pseudonocardia]OSY41172.1 Phosphorylated carbohydrates phosphatase [Pseudonocardia autotrophica]TDN76628.1 sugar-phosphatase [Pseudonocardia autotrophica]BBG00628.1 hydrolase [Pseudonocardia autotrophica]GEC28018.1 hydrolase [Pseudonocardia saturnea]